MHHQPSGKFTGLVWSFGLSNPSTQVQPLFNQSQGDTWHLVIFEHLHKVMGSKIAFSKYMRSIPKRKFGLMANNISYNIRNGPILGKRNPGIAWMSVIILLWLLIYTSKKRLFIGSLFLNICKWSVSNTKVVVNLLYMLITLNFNGEA